MADNKVTTLSSQPSACFRLATHTVARLWRRGTLSFTFGDSEPLSYSTPLLSTDSSLSIDDAVWHVALGLVIATVVTLKHRVKATPGYTFFMFR